MAPLPKRILLEWYLGRSSPARTMTSSIPDSDARQGLYTVAMGSFIEASAMEAAQLFRPARRVANAIALLGALVMRLAAVVLLVNVRQPTARTFSSYHLLHQQHPRCGLCPYSMTTISAVGSILLDAKIGFGPNPYTARCFSIWYRFFKRLSSFSWHRSRVGTFVGSTVQSPLHPSTSSVS